MSRLGYVLDRPHPQGRQEQVALLPGLNRRMETKPMEWAKLVIAMMKQLIAIISQRYEIGVEWNLSGCAPSAYAVSAVSAPSLPPPPAVPASPAPPAAPAAPAAPMGPEEHGKLGNLASELQNMVGENGVRNLRHVEKSEMSHKNPALRGNVKMETKKET